ncbi:ankyrin repeat domain-containing protein [Pseudomonas sp. B6002]|uniref:formyltransferase family protein n=1 Tax=Pseudomonas sp. B6002 TaxID=2726978 RepID=UPI0015A3D03A|nr:formyltransferase family protein [Pseudomonas sp. B6002]NVZ50063.1 ankyrin repeat domain-containing protein [Pseudomonas sp. B6002]
MRTICIAGKNNIAVEGLRYFVENHPDLNVVFIPNETDNGVDGWQLSFRKYALSENVQQVNLCDLYDVEDLLFISLEFAEIIKPEKFRSSELYNMHFSLLPKYKGMYTSALPLLHGERESGVTLHKIDAGIDTGNIISQLSFEIGFSDNARDLYFKYLSAAKELFLDNIGSVLSGDFVSYKQPSFGASYYSKSAINYSALSIDFRKCAFEVANQFRAFAFREYQMPRFGSWQIDGTLILDTKSNLKPGSVVGETGTGIVVSTIDYDLLLIKDYYPALWQASEHGDVAGIKSALEFVDDVDRRNAKGWSALIIAAYSGNSEAVELLLDNGASVSVTGYNGTTPLMYAFSSYERSNDSRAFYAILERGADPSAPDSKGKTIKDYMVERGCIDLISYV